MATWREMIEHELQGEEIVAVAPTADVLDVEFDDGYGSPEGPNFLAWTDTRVIFPVCYDGAEWVGTAPRHPVIEGQQHVGGY